AVAFAQTIPFNPGGFIRGEPGHPLRRQVESFLFAFDTDLLPAVGQQITLSDTSPPSVAARISLLQFGCGFVVAKGIVDGERRSWLRVGGEGYQPDRFLEPLISSQNLQALASVPGQELTFTCVPPADRLRMGLDADEDGLFDRDELDGGTDPDDPESGPPAPMLVSGQKLLIKNVLPDDAAKNLIAIGTKDPAITVPAPGTPSDPRCTSGSTALLTTTLTIRSATSGQSYSTPLPCYDWDTIGPPSASRGYKFKNSNRSIQSTVKTATWRSG